MGLKKFDEDGNLIEADRIELKPRVSKGKSLRYCRGTSSNPICGVLLDADTGEVRCPNCKKEFNRESSKRYRKIKDFYHSRVWDDKRNETRENSYHLCEVCAARGVLTECTEVHHIKSIWDNKNWEMRLDDSNLIALCSECHRRLHDNDIELLYGLDGYVESFSEGGVEVVLCKSLDEVYQRVTNR